jgi:K+ transport systems, NAD-binding component
VQTEWRTRVALAISVVVAIIAGYTLVYQAILWEIEGVRVGGISALQVVIEALTTAGFGGDSGYWRSPITDGFVIIMNLTGVALVFLALPYFIVPLLTEALSATPPTASDRRDHIIVCGYGTRGDVLQTELSAAGETVVVVVEDAEEAVELQAGGVEAVVGTPESEETMEAVNIQHAQSVIIALDDDARTLAGVLTARALAPEVPVVTVAESAAAEGYHALAGATSVIRPREAVGRALARKVMMTYTDPLAAGEALAGELEVSEVFVPTRSRIAGQSLADAALRDRYGVVVIAIWSDGELLVAPRGEVEITPRAVLLIVGAHQALEDVATAVGRRAIAPRDPTGVIVGFGEVGQSVATELDEQGITYRIVDRAEAPAVDVVGDITDPETREAAGLRDAAFVILAIGDDTTSMYATVALEEYCPGTDVLVRAESVESVEKLYRAGAEYVLALSTVAGRMLASTLIGSEEVLLAESPFGIRRVDAPGLVGRTLIEADVRARTGATVVAIETTSGVEVPADPTRPIDADATTVVAGTDAAIAEYIAMFE